MSETWMRSDPGKISTVLASAFPELTVWQVGEREEISNEDKV